MISRLSAGFRWISNRWWRVLAVYILNTALLFTMLAVEDRFTELTGYPVFDTQNELSLVEFAEQLQLYRGEARAIYHSFAVFDFFFPLVGAVFFSSFLAFLLRLNPSKLAVQMTRRNLFLLPLLVAVADWIENIGFLAVVSAGEMKGFWPGLAILAKRMKLFLLGFSAVLLAAAAIFLVIEGIKTRRKERNGTQTEQSL